jgi:hypothetical protein
MDPKFVEILNSQPPKQGRLPKFVDPGLCAKFLWAVEAGMSPASACRVIGSSPQLWKEWVHKAELGDELHEEFVSRVLQAEGECMSERMGDIEIAIHVARANGDIRGIMDYMGRRWPDEWGVAARTTLDIAIADATDTDDILRKLLPEAFAAGALSSLEQSEPSPAGSSEVHLAAMGEAEPDSPTGGLGRMAHPERQGIWQDKERRGMGPGTSGLPSIWADNPSS